MKDRYLDRSVAGRMLAQELLEYGERRDVMVLALPRGGVPVAHEYEVAAKILKLNPEEAAELI